MSKISYLFLVDFFGILDFLSKYLHNRILKAHTHACCKEIFYHEFINFKHTFIKTSVNFQKRLPKNVSILNFELHWSLLRRNFSQTRKTEKNPSDLAVNSQSWANRNIFNLKSRNLYNNKRFQKSVWFLEILENRTKIDFPLIESFSS